MSLILIVDDVLEIRELLARWLVEAKYPIRQASDAEAALQMMDSQPADVVLSDIEMPGKGGLWLVSQLRERFPRSAIVLATGLETVPPAISLQGGVIQYLVKPFKCEDVLAAVAEAVRWHTRVSAQGAAQTAKPDPVAEWLDAHTIVTPK